MFIRYHFFLLFEYLSTPPWSRFLVLPLSQSVNSWLGSNFHPPSADMLLDRILYVGYSRSAILGSTLKWSWMISGTCWFWFSFSWVFCLHDFGGKLYQFPLRIEESLLKYQTFEMFFFQASHELPLSRWLACFLGIMSSPHLPNNEMTQVMVRTTSNWRLPGSSKMERWTVYHPFCLGLYVVVSFCFYWYHQLLWYLQYYLYFIWTYILNCSLQMLVV